MSTSGGKGRLVAIASLLVFLFVLGLGLSIWLHLCPPGDHPPESGGLEFGRHASLHLAAIALEILLAYFLVHTWWEKRKDDEAAERIEELRGALKEFLDVRLVPLYCDLDADLRSGLGSEAARAAVCDAHRAAMPVSPEVSSQVCTIYRDFRTNYGGYQAWLREIDDLLTRNTTLFERLDPAVLSLVYRISNSINSLFQVPLVDGERYEIQTCQHFLDTRRHILDLLGRLSPRTTGIAP
jgi:hypothetical protein